MERLCEVLSGLVDRPVRDATGLGDAFDVELKYSQDIAAPPSGAPAKIAAANFPSLFTAVREQLGLRLAAKKGTATTWVVVRAEKPTEN
jgi:uncharacterized protein (TIGR03435 family)